MRPLLGLGFLAHITANGRVVFAREDDGKWWVYGVEPGGIAEGGGTSHEASLAFFKRKIGVKSVKMCFCELTTSCEFVFNSLKGELTFLQA